MKPVVTVLLPVAEPAPWLDQAILSVQRQTLQDWTLYILLDGTSINTAERVIDLTENDPRSRAWLFSKSGLSKTLRSGMECVETPWVARLDADDRMMPRRLERQLQEAEKGFHVVGSNVLEYDDVEVGTHRSYPWTHQQCMEALGSWRPNNPIAHSAAFMRTSAVMAAGNYDPSWKLCQDYELWQRMLRWGARFCNIQEYLTARRIHPGQVSNKSWKRRWYAYRALIHHKLA